MSSQEASTSSARSPVPTAAGNIPQLDIIVHMSNYLKFKDYLSYTRALWPYGDEPEEVKAQLKRLSTFQVTTEFLNGQSITVICNYNLWRTDDETLLFNVQSLAPLFGSISPTSLGEFESLTTLQTFVMDHVNMDWCSELQYASCFCHLGNHESLLGRTVPEAEANPCPHGCFHHYCSLHVRFWMDVYLMPSVYSSLPYANYHWFQCQCLRVSQCNRSLQLHSGSFVYFVHT